MTRAIRIIYVLTLLVLGYFIEQASLQDSSSCRRSPTVQQSDVVLAQHQYSLEREQGVFQCCNENEWDDDTLLGSIGGCLQFNPNLANQIAFTEYVRHYKKRVLSAGSQRSPPEELG